MWLSQTIEEDFKPDRRQAPVGFMYQRGSMESIGEGGDLQDLRINLDAYPFIEKGIELFYYNCAKG